MVALGFPTWIFSALGVVIHSLNHYVMLLRTREKNVMCSATGVYLQNVHMSRT